MSLTIDIPFLRTRLSAFKSYRLDSDFVTPADAWEAQVLPTTEAEWRSLIRKGHLQPVELLVNGRSQVLGRVDGTTVGAEGSAITLRGRDYIADVVECNVHPVQKIDKSATLETAILSLLGVVGIGKLEGDDLKRNIRTGRSRGGPVDQAFRQLKTDDYKPKPGEGLYELCARILARHSLTLQPGSSRDTVVLQAPNYSQPSSYEIRRMLRAGGNTTALKATATRDYSSTPSYVLFVGRQGGGNERRGSTRYDFSVAEKWGSVSGEIGETLGAHMWSGVADNRAAVPDNLYRLLYHRDEHARNQAQLEAAAKRALADRLKETLKYSVTLRGFTDPDTGSTWAVDTMVDVHDEVCDVSETLWVASRTFISDEQGERTELECWRPDSYVL